VSSMVHFVIQRCHFVKLIDKTIYFWQFTLPRQAMKLLPSTPMG